MTENLSSFQPASPFPTPSVRDGAGGPTKQSEVTQPTSAKYEGTLPVYLEYGAELPPRYGLNFIRAMVRDPECIFVYWELTRDKIIEAFVGANEKAVKEAKWVLRVHNLTQVTWADTLIRPPFAFDHRDSNWYLSVLPDTEYCIELGVILPDGRFISLLRSNTVRTPRRGFAISQAQEEIWLGSYIFYQGASRKR